MKIILNTNAIIKITRTNAKDLYDELRDLFVMGADRDKYPMLWRIMRVLEGVVY